MRTWTMPTIPALPGRGQQPKLFNSSTSRLEHPPLQDGRASLYVCGITPYDATHIGHAFTYLTFDIMQRAWIDAGIEVDYAQNITDIDDPLLERASATGVNWKQLAEEQVSLYRSDMYRLSMLPPKAFVAVTEVIDDIASAVEDLVRLGLTYELRSPDSEYADIYFDTNHASQETQWRLGDVSGLERQLMLTLNRERGGDPDREGKRDPLDPLLWRGKRDGEPSWESVLGEGRPGWHIECSAIAVKELGNAFTVQGGGADLIFPHHEFSAAHATASTGTPLAHLYSHAALVSYDGSKMSKSQGNLVFVSRLLDRGVDPAALRLALLNHHYREEWEWFDSDLEIANRRLAAWRAGYVKDGNDRASSLHVIQQLRAALANDLDTPVMLVALDVAWDRGVDDPKLLADATEALLGVSIRPEQE